MTDSPIVPETLGQLFHLMRRDYRRHDSRILERTFWAMCTLRFGQYAIRRRLPPWRWFLSKVYGLSRLVTEISTGVVVCATMKVGRDLHLIHADGQISIHPETVIGDRCGIMHNVTIGTNMGTAAPVIGDDVFIGAGSCVLGGVTIGDRVHISANSLVMTDVPADSTVIGVPARVMPRLMSLSPPS